jgi:hypothetical protein
MKIRLRKSKNSVSLKIEAGKGDEGLDLKEAVLAMATSGDFDALFSKLETLGYRGDLTRETRNIKEFTVQRAGGEK